MTNIAWGRFTVFSTLIVGAGYALMKATTPTEEEFYNALAPDLKRKVDEIRRQRATSEEMRAKLESSAAENKVVWADTTAGQQGTPRRV